MKKVISLVLAVTMLISVLTVSAVAAEDCDLKIAVASDLHYSVPRDALEGDIDDPIYWYSNRRAAMEDESGWIIDEFLAQCAVSDCEYILIPGDVANNGRENIEEHYAIADKLAAFEEATGKPVFVINGNHDIGEGRPTDVAKFKEIYAELGYDLALEKDDETCSYTADLGDKYRLIALDSCDPTVSTADGVTTRLVEWVCDQAEQAQREGRYPILMMHHNLLNHMPLQTVFSKNFIVKNHLAVADAFANSGIKTVFSGHEHCSDAAVYTSSLGNIIYDFATTSLTMYPLKYRVVSYTEDEIEYEDAVIDSIDTDSLTAAVSGYTPEMVALMNSGLNAYAKGFLKKGIEYRLALSLSMEKIGIEEDAVYYDLVNAAVTGLTDILEMPLYGENSVQQLAAEYGIEIPDSSYKTGWDLATDVVAAHYAGEEAYELEGPEVTILLRTVSLILVDDLAGISDEAFLGAANSLLALFGTETATADLFKLGLSVYGNPSAGQYFILALASPLLYSFAYDSDGVNDNRGVLPGYGTVTPEGNMENVVENVNTISVKIFNYVAMILNYVQKIIDMFK